MKIGIHSYVFYPESFLINDLAFKFAMNGHEVIVSSSLPNYDSKKFRPGYTYMGPYKERINETLIFRYPVWPRKTGFLHLFLNYSSNFLFGILNLSRLPRVDVSFVFGVSPAFMAFPALILKKLFNIPVVIWLQDPWPESFAAVVGISPKSPIYKSIGVFVRWMYSHTALIFIQSEAYRAHLEAYGFKGRIEFLPNWAPEKIGQNPIDYGSPSPKWMDDFPQGKFILTFAGNIGIGQGLDELIKTLSGLDPKPFVALVGDGTEVKNLQKLVERLGLQEHVHFYGRRPLSEMTFLFQKSSALFVSLKGGGGLSQLTIPSKLQAYMMSGRPVLASLYGEGARIVEESKCGWVASPGDSESLKISLKKMLSTSQEDLKDMGNNATAYANLHFDKKKLVFKIETILKELVE